MVVESFVGLIGMAIATGLCFAKFSRPQARVAFSDVLVVANRSGRPCLTFRMANERNSRIIDAQIQLYVLTDERTPEGEQMRRFYPLALERDRSPVFLLSWTVMHFLDGSSPLAGLTARDVRARMVSLVAIVTGVDDAFVQTVHAQHYYMPEHVRFGHRFEDIIENQDGVLVVHHDRLSATVEVPTQ